MRRLVAALILAAIAVTPLRADLRFVTRLTAKPSTVPLPPPSNPMFTMLGGVVIGTIVPLGGLRITAVVGDQGARIEYDQPYVLIPAGAVMLVRPDGSAVVLQPAQKTYWKVAKTTVGVLGGALATEVEFKSTGQTATIAGLEASQSTLSVRVPLPLPSEGGLPGMPREITASGEVWLAPEHARYAKLTPVMANGLAAAIGIDTTSADGFPMRMVLRSELFAGQEIESVVTSIGEVSTPPGAFDIPEGYTEVPQPALPGIGVGR